MKKILLSIGTLLLSLSACNNFAGLEDRVDKLEDRVTYLEELCKDMNANVTTLQAFVKAHENNLFVTSVEEVSDGFTITFSDGQKYVLKNGEKGNKGEIGESGPAGPAGPEGKTPAVGLTKLEDGSIVWTVDGETVLADGKPVSALGVTPRFEIREGSWVVSYDEGKTWETVAPAYDNSNKLVISEDDDFVYFSFGSDESFTLAKGGGFSFVMERVSGIGISAGQTVEIPFTLKQGDETVYFDVRCTGGFNAVVDAQKGVVVITAPSKLEDGYVIVTAVKNSTGEVKAQYVTFSSNILTLVSDAHNAPSEGGIVEIVFDTNLDYTVTIPASCDWITKAPGTKAAVSRETVQLIVAANTGAARNAEVSIVPETGSHLKVLISQDSAADFNPNTFTYVLWGVEGKFVGNNLGLTPLTKYPNQFRMKEGDASLKLVPLESDIPEGATVTFSNPGVSGAKNWKLTNSSNMNDGVSGFKSAANEEEGIVAGQFTLAYTSTPTAPRIHILTITVTVSGLGGEQDVPVSKVIPIFVDQYGYKTIGDDDFCISYTPFVLRANPKTGGELQAPVITAKASGAPSMMRLDFRRNFFFFNFGGPASHSDGKALSASNGEATLLGNVWRSYFEANEATVNYGSCTPVSYYNDHNSEVEGKLATTGLYIDNANGMKVVLNPDKFKDKDGIYANGVFYGTINANSAGANPIAAQQAETYPFVVWLDPTYTE